MRVVCLSDTHNQQGRLVVPEGDVLVHAGDLTERGSPEQVATALRWLRSLPHPRKVLIAGNHDFLFEDEPTEAAALVHGLDYLQDSAVVIAGVKFYGSPYQPWFYDWAFNFPEHDQGSAAQATWAKVPEDTEVLITHGPPANVLDLTQGGHHVGCPYLLERVWQVRPKLHVFGHIHEDYGVVRDGGITFANAATCDRQYRPVHAPLVFELSARGAELIEPLSELPR